MTNSSDDTDLRHPGGWLPSEQDELEQWLAGLPDRAEADEQVELHPLIAEFRELLDRDAIARMYVEQMIVQEPTSGQYQKCHLEDVPQMLRLINTVLTTAPEFSESAPVATPLTAVIGWTMGTLAGFAEVVHDPDDPYWGFTSWNDFFTRRFREGQRPVRGSWTTTRSS